MEKATLDLDKSKALETSLEALLYLPEEHFSELFEKVQMLSVFPDRKTFADCIPLCEPEKIIESYHQEKDKPDFDLKAFVTRNFESDREKEVKVELNQPVAKHIERLWPLLTRQSDTRKSSLIPLPYPYIVPGGRFKEIYYWDSYFTMLGLQINGQISIIQNMIDNFAHLINTIGHIPNGNRSYYVSRSQPPFFALMISLLAEEKGEEVFKIYGPALAKEYAFWMDGAESLSETKLMHRRVVRISDGSILNRYWDNKATPRTESYEMDISLQKECGRNPEELFRHIRAVCESGWDFSSRWLEDAKTMGTIRAADLIPVDLNALIYNMELTLAKIAQIEKNKEREDLFTQKAEDRKAALLKYCWNDNDNFFYDYDFVNGKTTDIPTLAAVYPLYFKMVDSKHAQGVATKLEADFLKAGGLRSTLNYSGQQWDAPNGWAPLQWMSIQGLHNYDYTKLADTVASNWINLNIKVYNRHGKLTEKYNVEDPELEGGGGEYLNQDGFGWTNGVLLKLLAMTKKI